MKNSKTIKEFEGLDYVTVFNVPIRKLSNGEIIIDVSPHELERKVAIALLESRVPIRGRELKVIKSAMNLSFEQLGVQMKTTSQTVKNWAKKLDDRLSPGAEALFRILASEHLGVVLRPTLSDVIADDQVKKVKVDAA